METLFRKHQMFISQVKMDIIREIINDINWERQLVAIKGSRGVGKTTLMRQYIRKTYGTTAGKALYCVLTVCISLHTHFWNLPSGLH